MNKKGEFTTDEVATALVSSMTDHDVGWANLKGQINSVDKIVVNFTMSGYKMNEKKFKITIEEA